MEQMAPKQRPTVMRLMKFGKPELPLVVFATFLSSISALLHMSQNVFVGLMINSVHYSRFTFTL